MLHALWSASSGSPMLSSLPLSHRFIEVYWSSGLVSFLPYSTFCLVLDRFWNTRHLSQGPFCTKALCWNAGMLPGSVLDPSGFCP